MFNRQYVLVTEGLTIASVCNCNWYVICNGNIRLKVERLVHQNPVLKFSIFKHQDLTACFSSLFLKKRTSRGQHPTFTISSCNHNSNRFLGFIRMKQNQRAFWVQALRTWQDKNRNRLLISHRWWLLGATTRAATEFTPPVRLVFVTPGPALSSTPRTLF